MRMHLSAQPDLLIIKLIEKLRDSDRRTPQCRRSLGMQGTRALEAIPVLSALLSDSDPEVRGQRKGLWTTFGSLKTKVNGCALWGSAELAGHPESVTRGRSSDKMVVKLPSRGNLATMCIIGSLCSQSRAVAHIASKELLSSCFR